MTARRISRRALLSTPVIAGAGLAAMGFADPAAPPRRGGRALGPALSPFLALCGEDGALTSLRRAGDAFDTDYIEAKEQIGHITIAYRRAGEGWRNYDTASGTSSTEAAPGKSVLRYRIDDDQGPALGIEIILRAIGEHLDWAIVLDNRSGQPIEIGDVKLPLPMNWQFKAKQPVTASVLKHSFVSGHGSWMFWMRANSVGPYLTMTPDPSTHLEYWDQSSAGRDRGSCFCVYIHAAAAGAVTRKAGSTWRQPLTSLMLAVSGAQSRRRYGMRFSWSKDYAAVRDTIVARGLIDVDVVPGMTVPTDLSATIALRSNERIAGVDAEHPGATRIERLGRRAGRTLYRVHFARLGENRLTIRHGKGRTTHLEFFVTEPVETLIAKRAAFIVRRQHRDASKWYDGLFGEWNMASGTLLGPDNYDRIKGWRIYEVTCDDPGLSKPAFLASKNAEFAVQAEIDALELYVDRFVWGGLQRTTEESRSYGIYGIPDWKQNRESADPGNGGRMHIWRPYDYPHIFTLYLGLYRAARRNPQIRTRTPAKTYLERAYGTALAMFTIPLEVTGWSAYQTGFYNELVLPDLIDELAAAGMMGEAGRLRAHWTRKIRYFVQEDADLFGSEYPFDSTGFESTQALARYALDDPARSGVTPAEAKAFGARQMAANLFCRGWLEPAYYHLGSDYRAQGGDSYTLSYMAQMGGWAVLDHALYDATDPHPLLRLGYASFLSAWALMNTGTAESNYGYWYPGEGNDGGAGGGFEPAPTGTTWLDQPHTRGSWYYSCEIDLGFCGGLRGAATVLADDPIFGRICYGGIWSAVPGGVAMTPRDGIRRRVHLRLDTATLDLELVGGRFAAERRIVFRADGRDIRFRVERVAPSAPIELRVAGLPDGIYRLSAGDSVATVTIVAGRGVFAIPPGGDEMRLSG
ncbi:DUF5695 domain-containing protein [Sphingomonas alpina]|uniref:Tat pathway signal sequence domain protein n=1 Tax=Sphingomonas alpina TaxID=653931 RepID=A0A7H0LJ95_9SPHN|nr:DUF5695 domain-containing protein [Sphingomonas alpina]QNQ09748.1 hypothetical protein H3Z74_00335 [Sphingomonas alpina]